VEFSDEVLAERAASGDTGAFETLVNRHRVGVYRLARSITRNHEDADDAAQETFLRVYRALGTYDPGRPFKPWLKRIAHNTALNILRTSRGGSTRIDQDSLPELPDPSPGPDCGLETGQTVSGIRQAMARMPAELRSTLLLRTVEGMSYKDIAGTMGVRIGTVMSRLSRAREKVLEALEAPKRDRQRGEKV